MKSTVRIECNNEYISFCRMITFIELKPRLVNVLMNALQHETDAQNTHMLLGGLLMVVQDSAWFEECEHAANGGSGGGGGPAGPMDGGFAASPAPSDANLLSSGKSVADCGRACGRACLSMLPFKCTYHVIRCGGFMSTANQQNVLYYYVFV